MIDPRSAVIAAERGLASLVADPIKHFRFSSLAQRRFVKSFHEYPEVYLRSGNGAGKTHIAAHFFVALMRGVTSFCGDIVGLNGVVESAPPVSLPLLGTPVSGVVLCHGREMSKESVIKALNLAVGKWPHHWEKTGTVIAALWVKPDHVASEEWGDWSCLRIFVEQGQSVEGMRLDFVWADEPPDWPMWRSLRMRIRRNRPLLRAITATPLEKPRWKNLRVDYKPIENNRGEERPGKDGKIEIRMAVFDNLTLSPDHLETVRLSARGNDSDAKLYGDYVDTTGSCPFDSEGLVRWREHCFDPIEVCHFNTRQGLVEYQVWRDVDPNEGYMVVADPSGGIEDEAGERDPAGIVVVSATKREVVARYNGYLVASELGRLALHLAHKYNNAFLVWERNSGYGEAFYDGIGDYGNVYFEHHLDSQTMQESERIGWYTTATTRGTLIGALQKAILTPGSLFLYSEDAVESLSNVTVKRDGIRIEAGAGSHDEDMIVLGIACHLLATRSVPMPVPRSLTDRFYEANGIRRAKAGSENEFVDF